MSRRVLIVADVVGGVRTFVRDLAAELAGRGDDVHLALIGPEGGAAAFRALPVASTELCDLRLEWMAEPWDDVARTAAWVAELVEHLRPDVLHLNTFGAAGSRRNQSPVPSPTPTVLTVHSDVATWWRAVHGCDAPPEWDRYRRLVSDALHGADLVVTPTAALRDAIAAVYGPLGRARVIPNGSSVPAGGPPAAERAPLVLTAGRLWDAAKNARALVAAAPGIEGDVELLGEGTDAGAVPHEAVLAALRRAAVFAEPARYEPFGLAALEAARCGCALVLGDIPSLREVWADAATYVDPEEPDALAHAINRLLGDPAARSRAAAAAGARSRPYTAAGMADAYRAAYDTVRPAVLIR